MTMRSRPAVHAAVVVGTLALASLVTPEAQTSTTIDHHQHLFSVEAAALAPAVKPWTGDDLITMLDEARIERAAVFSIAYQFSNPNRPPVADEYARVRAENDWTSTQVARHPARLRAFCSVNPLRDYALDEIRRCAKDPFLRHGLKLHFGNSDVDLMNPQHVAAVREVFRTANINRMAIVVHLRPSVTMRRPYGAAQARTFLDDVLPAASDVPVQIAHLAGAGGYDDPAIDQALSVFIEAISTADARLTRVYFDASGVAGLGQWTEKAPLIARRIRELGVRRILYGSDGTTDLMRPRDALAAFRQLPLSEEDFQTIASNVAPYMR